MRISNTDKSWPEYRRRFERYQIAAGLDEKSGFRQVGMLLHCTSKETESIFKQLKVSKPRAAVVADEGRGIAAVETENKDGSLYNRPLEALDAYFNPHSNTLHYAVLLGSRIQHADESNEHYQTTI